MNLADRENEILRILNLLSKSTYDFIVVGGYAVSAHAKHRFSLDCDLVVKNTDIDPLESLLEKEGFRKETEKDHLDKRYGGGFIRYAKMIGKLPVRLDLLTNSLVCRQTEASWGYEYILANSVVANVPGIQESVKARIPKRELLMAFKLHSARKPDVRDVVMLGEEADWKLVLEHLKRGSSKKLKESLRKFAKSLTDKGLINSLKGEFSLQGNVDPRLRRSKEQLQKITEESAREDARSSRRA